MIDEYDEWSTGFWIVLVLAFLGVLVLVGLAILTILDSIALVVTAA